MVTIALLTLLPVALDAGQAQAHDVLVSTQPAIGSTVTAGPPEVRLTFDKPVQFGFTEVEVAGPGGTTWGAGSPRVSGNTVTQSLRPLGPVGRYVIHYRIVSADGHPVSGEVGFTLAVAGSGSPAAAAVRPRSVPANAVSASSSAAPASGGFPFWSWFVAGAALAVLLGLLLARRLGRE